jgi:hypothetical protein
VARDDFWLAAAGFILLLTGAKVLWIEPGTNWFRLSSPVDAPAGMTRAVGVRFSNGLELIGYDLPRTEARQGGEVRVRLFWRSNGPLSDDVRSFVHLDAPVTGVTWANQTKDQAGEMPSRLWPSDFYVVDDFRLRVPGDAPPVSMDLVIGLLTREGVPVPLADGRLTLPLATVAIQGRGQPFARFPAPQGAYRLGESIELRGYAAQRQAEEVLLTLRWRSDVALETDYTVFAQVFDAAGEMVGQLDGPACGGACPTSRWTPGGVIEDTRRIPVRVDSAQAGLRVRVGLYDPATNTRLPVWDARGAEAPDGAIEIEVASSEGR